MKIVDANVLLNAVNEAAEAHEAARSWLLRALAGDEAVAFSWLVILAFLRLSTRGYAFPSPLSVGDACDLVERWLSLPPAQLLHPTEQHAAVLFELLDAAGTGGNLVNDAHLAALAIEHGAEVVSFDTDFARFPGLRWQLLSGP